jgi:uncharacterized membrane protein
MAVGVVIVFCLLLGIACGFRSLTGPAVVCWGAHFGWLDLAGSPIGFLASPITLVIFTILAIGELIGDKTSKIGPRIAPVPFGIRVVMGALCGAALATDADAGLVFAAIAGAVGAVAGTLGGYHIRRSLTAPGQFRDLPVALVEDLITIGGSFFIVSRF